MQLDNPTPRSSWVDAVIGTVLIVLMGVLIFVLVHALHVAPKPEPGPAPLKKELVVHEADQVRVDETASQAQVVISKAARNNQRQKRETVDEVYAPSGQLTTRHIVRESDSKTQVAVDTVATTAHLVAVAVDESATREEITHETQLPAGATSPRLGVSTGVVVTGDGIGPAAFLALGQWEHVDVDAFVGAVGVHAVGGVSASYEVWPRTYVGAGVALTPAGNPWAAYSDPARPELGLAPVFTVQYQF